MHTGIREARAHTRFERQTSDGNKIWRNDGLGRSKDWCGGLNRYGVVRISHLRGSVSVWGWPK